MSKKTVNIDTAQDVSGKHLSKWLEMTTDDMRFNFRYERFVTEEEAEKIEHIIVYTNDDESWREALDILKPHLKEIVEGAKEVANSDDPMAALGNQKYMIW